MKDLLNRNGDIENLINIINGMTKNGGSCSFAIDGAWGCGKSWVLDRLERRLQGVGDDEEVNLNKVKGNYFVFHYNAWENDYYEEPLIAILTTFYVKLNELYAVENLAKAIGKETIGKVLSFINETIKRLTGIDVAQTAKQIKNRKSEPIEFAEENTIGKIIKNVRKNLKDLANSQMSNSETGDEKFPLIFIVDELDRCLPEYAIKVLERLHHVFYGIDRCVMILSIDKRQLNHTVQNIFGESVNNEAYLAKFIDFTVNLNEGSIDEELFWQEFEDYKKSFCPLFINSSYNYSKVWTENLFRGIPMRERLQIVRKAKLIHSMLTDKKYQSSVMYYEIFSVIRNQIGKYDRKAIIEYENAILYINDNVTYQSKIENAALKFVEGKISELCKKYGRIHKQYNTSMTSDFYFVYMFYIYEVERNNLAVSLLDSESEKAIVEEKNYVKKFISQLNVIN